MLDERRGEVKSVHNDKMPLRDRYSTSLILTLNDYK